MHEQVTRKHVPDISTKKPRLAGAGVDVSCIGILCSCPEFLKEVMSMFRAIDMEHSSRIEIIPAVSIEEFPEKCEMALVCVHEESSIDQAIANMAMLREQMKVSIIFGLVSSRAMQAVEARRSEIPTNHIVPLPISASEFNHIIMSGIAALKIKENKKNVRNSFAQQSKFLGNILVENNVIDPLQLKKALDHQDGANLKLGDALVLLGYITEEQKLLFLSQQLGVEVPSPRQFTSADQNVVALIPEHISRQGNCIALEIKGGRLFVAMEDVTDLQLLDSLHNITNMAIVPMLASHADIHGSIERYFNDIRAIESATAFMDNAGGDLEFVDQKDDNVDIDEAATASSEAGVVMFVNKMLVNAVRDKASDIHIEPQENNLNVRYRIDGDLKSVLSPSLRLHPAIVARIKILSNLDIAERRLPQDGRMVVRTQKREIDIRVSILPTVYGEAAVLRILDKDAFEKSVTNLGFDRYHLEIFRKHITRPYGMIIVTGPTGSGKSTTLYSAIQQIKNSTRNIVTVEDPVEFHMDGIRQVQVNGVVGLTFAKTLRSILRQDPDIILIGEIRDLETADTAIKMALTGHLVFSTLHTNDAVSTISRFVDIGIPPLLLSSSLNLVIAQRLVRRICSSCKVSYKPESDLLRNLGMEIDTPPDFFMGKGCVSCNGTGYSGRTGVFEMLQITRSIRNLVLRNVPPQEIHEAAVKEGMRTLRTACMEKVLSGETTIEQLLAITMES